MGSQPQASETPKTYGGSAGSDAQASEKSAVVMDFEIARRPVAAHARDLAAEAETKWRPKASRDVAQERTTVLMLNPYLLHVEPGWNSRDPDDPSNHAHVDRLARLIARDGVLESLIIRYDGDSNRYLVGEGHMRLLATFRAIEVYGAPLRAIKCVYETVGTTVEDRLSFQGVINNNKKPMTNLEYGLLFAKFIRLGWSADQIAHKVGVSVTHVRELLTLNHILTPAIRRAISIGELRRATFESCLKRYDLSVTLFEILLPEARQLAASEVPPRRRKTDRPTVPKIMPRHVKDALTLHRLGPTPLAAREATEAAAGAFAQSSRQIRSRSFSAFFQTKPIERTAETVTVTYSAEDYDRVQAEVAKMFTKRSGRVTT